jgi:hypothetical protein
MSIARVTFGFLTLCLAGCDGRHEEAGEKADVAAGFTDSTGSITAGPNERRGEKLDAREADRKNSAAGRQRRRCGLSPRWARSCPTRASAFARHQGSGGEPCPTSSSRPDRELKNISAASPPAMNTVSPTPKTVARISLAGILPGSAAR